MPLALITWLETPVSPTPPVGIWPGPRPSHPIMLPGMPGWGSGGSPPGIWGGPWLPPYPDNSLPGNQPYPDNSLPGNQPYPDNTLPGSQPRPDHSLPPFATNLPVIPPQQPLPDPDNPDKAYIVAYMPKEGGGFERITFMIDLSGGSRPPPTHPQPKPATDPSQQRGQGQQTNKPI